MHIVSSERRNNKIQPFSMINYSYHSTRKPGLNIEWTVPGSLITLGTGCVTSVHFTKTRTEVLTVAVGISTFFNIVCEFYNVFRNFTMLCNCGY